MVQARTASNVVVSIVDDDESMREALVDFMSSLGFISQAFGRSRDFLRSEWRRTTQCLIADVHMPEMSGLELYDHLAVSSDPIPTVLITAYPDENVRARALSAGALGYLVKPFSEAALLGCIHAALDRSPDRRDAPPRP
jgi:FixJ family two-component response regulator